MCLKNSKTSEFTSLLRYSYSFWPIRTCLFIIGLKETYYDEYLSKRTISKFAVLAKCRFWDSWFFWINGKIANNEVNS